MSYRRTNDPSGLEVESSTAGATAGRDLATLISAINAFYQVIEEPADSPRIQNLDLQLVLSQLVDAALSYRRSIQGE